MSLSPYFLNDFLNDFGHPFRTGSIFNQNFGLSGHHDDLVRPLLCPHVSGYIRPWRHQTVRNGGVSHIQNSEDAFKVNLDVQQFKPDEINVKMVDNYVVVEGKHEERPDEHGFISRQFQRRYRLPDDVNPNALVSKLSSDGVLSIEAPKKAIESTATHRVVPITHTNAPAVTPVSHATEKKASKGEKDGDKVNQ
ncbi:hypothetical protein R5R35_010450 [Gryllus longicercus]|uniref:SHSP domain-containing protein n=1 Tax=Gryllus longicercus TaxID=2509291 RepID=A0AAN9VWB9_9ORTH